MVVGLADNAGVAVVEDGGVKVVGKAQSFL